MSPGAADSTPPSVKRANDRRGWPLAAAAIGAAGILLRVMLAPQFDGLDDAGYLDAARRVSEGRGLEGLFPLFRVRVGMAYPLGWLQHAGWLAPAQFWWLTIGAECVTLVAIFAIGWRLRGALAGLAAMLMYAVYPLAVQQATLFYPTSFQVMCIALACLLIVIAAQVRSWRAGWLLAFVAGLTLGLGYLVKEDVAIVVPAIVIASIAAGYPRRSLALFVCAGAAMVFAGECLAYWQSTGHPLFRLTASSGLGAESTASLQMSEIWRWDAFLRSLFLMPLQVGIAWWLAIPAAWMAWRSRDSRLRFLCIAFAVLAAYLQFGSGSFTAYTPLPKTPRYTAILTPFLMVMLGAWLAHAIDRGHRLRAAAIVTAAILAALPCIGYLGMSASERTRNTLAVLPMLKHAAPPELYTDYYSARVLRILDPDLPSVRVWYHARFDAREMFVMEAPAGEGDAYVLLDRQAAKIYTSSYELPLPAEVAHPPAAWTLVWRGRAYADGSVARSVLEAARRAAEWLPAGNPAGSRIRRNISDMIDGDQAMLYRVPAHFAIGNATSRDASSASAVAPALLTQTPMR